MDKKFETIVFSTKSYRTNWRDDSEYDKTAMWIDIADVIRILTAQDYQCRVYEEDFHTVIIEYNYKGESLGGPTLEWVGEDEYVCNPKDEVEIRPVEDTSTSTDIYCTCCGHYLGHNVLYDKCSYCGADREA